MYHVNDRSKIFIQFGYYNSHKLAPKKQYFNAKSSCTVEPRYNEDFWTMKITLLYQVSHISISGF